MNSEVVQQEQAERGPAAAWSAAALAATALTACGGAGDEPDDTPKPDRATPETLTVPWPDENQAARFLGQAALAATPENVADVVRDGYEVWLTTQLNMPRERTAMDLMVMADPFEGWLSAVNMSTDIGVDNVIWWGLFNAKDELRQRVMFALSEIFVTSVRNMPIPYGQVASVAYWDLLGDNCFGNFLDLLEKITLSPAMGTYLSMRGSSKADGSGRHPDENFAREVLQLFTIGLVELDAYGEPVRDGQGQPVYTYDTETVTQLARVFSGWDFDADWVDFLPGMTYHYTTKPMRFHPERYDTDPKWVLKPSNTITAAPGRATVRQALQYIVNHPNVGPFLARQLIQRLVTSNPEREHVARVAAAFNDNGAGVRGDMKAVIRAVLLDPLARLATLPDATQQGRRGKLREPVLRLVQWGRLTAIRSNDGFWRAGNMSGSDKLSQGPMRAASVFNFFRPGFTLANTGPQNQPMLAPEFQITDESSVIGYVNYLQEILPEGMGYTIGARLAPTYDDWEALAATPARLVDGLNLLLTGRTLSQHTLSVVTAAVTAAQAADGETQERNRVLAAFYLIMSSADYMVQR